MVSIKECFLGDVILLPQGSYLTLRQDLCLSNGCVIRVKCFVNEHRSCIDVFLTSTV